MVTAVVVWLWLTSKGKVCIVFCNCTLFDLFNHKCAQLVIVSFMRPCYHNNLNYCNNCVYSEGGGTPDLRKINRLARFYGSDAPLNYY